MLNQLVEDEWERARKELTEVLAEDRFVAGSKPIPTPIEAFEILARQYVRYIAMVHRLTPVADFMLHPQKRQVVRKVLEMCFGRILELRFDFRELQMTDFSYVDNALLEFKMTRGMQDFAIPGYFRLDRVDELKTVEEIIRDVKNAKKPLTPPESPPPELERRSIPKRFHSESEDEDEGIQKKTSEAKILLTPEQQARFDLVNIFQRHERARTARLKYQKRKEYLRLMEDIAYLRHKPIPNDVRLQVATTIQRYWRGYCTRRHMKYEDIERKKLLHLILPSIPDTLANELMDEAYAERAVEQKRAFNEMEATATMARIRLERTKTDDIRDDIVEELRYFVYQWYQFTRKCNQPQFPDLPDPYETKVPGFGFSGLPKDTPKEVSDNMVTEVINTLVGYTFPPISGTGVITAGYWLSPKMFMDVMVQIKAYKKKNPRGPKKLSAEALQALKELAIAEAAKAKEIEAKKLADLKKQGFLTMKSKILLDMNLTNQRYELTFPKGDLATNPGQEHNPVPIEEEVARKYHFELRRAVDEMMHLELKRLQIFLKRDYKRYKMKFKKKKPMKFKIPRPPKPNKPDLTSHLSREDIFRSLAQKGLLIEVPNTRLSDLPGDYGFCIAERRLAAQDPIPAVGDIRQLLKEFICLPLGSNLIKSIAPTDPSFLLMGSHKQTTIAVDGIARETGSLLFRIDPLCINKIYKKKMLTHVLTKLPVQLAPVVIHIDHVDKCYYKSVPPEEKKAKAKKFARLIKKMTKGAKSDRVVIIGTSCEPALCKKSMLKAFKRVLVFNEEEYGTRQRYFYETLMKCHGMRRDVNCSALAMATMESPFSDIEKAVEEHMSNIARVLSMKSSPFREVEIVDRLPLVDDPAFPKPKKWKPEKTRWQILSEAVKLYKERLVKVEADAEMMQRILALEKKAAGAGAPAPKGKKKKGGLGIFDFEFNPPETKINWHQQLNITYDDTFP